MRPVERGNLELHLARVAADLSRRRFLKISALAVGAGLVPTSCVDMPTHLGLPEGLELKVMDPWEYALVNAVARRMLGAKPAAMIDSREVDPARYLDETCALLDRSIFGRVRMAFGFLEYAPWPILPKFSRFTRASEEVQDRVLLDMQQSSLGIKKSIFVALKLLSGPAFYANAPAWRLMDYPGPPWNAPGRHALATQYPDAWPEPGPLNRLIDPERSDEQ